MKITIDTTELGVSMPAFPPRNFDYEWFATAMIKSDMEEVKIIREVLKPHLQSIPREYKTMSQRVDYLINKQ